MPDSPAIARVTLSLLLNAATPFSTGATMFVQIANSGTVSQSFRRPTPTAQVELPFHDGPGDDYRVVVHVDGYHDAGAIVRADPRVHRTVSMLMIPSHATLSFPAWSELKAADPATARLIAAGVNDADAEARYTALGHSRPLALASLMNLSAAMNDIGLGAQKTPLDFIREIVWDDTLAQDRFFAYADPGIIPLVQAAAAEGEFAEEKDCATFHHGATLSYKQTQFDYSNVQLTFHERDTKPIDGITCIKIEPDMDLYKELVAHGLGEVLPNKLNEGLKLTKGLTDPLRVLALRWIDAVQNDEPLFNPGYMLR